MVSLILAVVLMTACGKEQESGQSTETAAAAQMPVDIVSHVTDSLTIQNELSSMDEGMKKNYTVLLDGCSDNKAGYYLFDVTGDDLPELMLGADSMTVYSCNQGSVMTIGTLMIQDAYWSEKDGFLAFYDNEGDLELRQYQYNGELFNEYVLVSAGNTADYSSQAEVWLADSQELKRYDLADRTPFE